MIPSANLWTRIEAAVPLLLVLVGLSLAEGCAGLSRQAPRASVIERARALVQEGRRAEAESLLMERLRSAPPEARELRRLLAEVRLLDQRPDAALDALAPLLAEEGRDEAAIAAQVLAGRAHLDAGRLDEAARAFGTAIEIYGATHPDPAAHLLAEAPDAPIWQAYRYFPETLIRLERYEEAIEALTPLLAAATDEALSYRIHYLLALAHHRQGRNDAALDELGRAAALGAAASPRDLLLGETLYGKVLTALGRVREAVGHYLIALDQAQGEQDRQALKGEISDLVRRRLRVADLQALRRDHRGTWIGALAELGLIEQLERRERYEDALTWARSLVDTAPAELRPDVANVIRRIRQKQLVRPNRIGFIAPLTGPLATWGQHIRQGVDLAIAEFNRFLARERLELIVRDSQGDPERAAAALRDLVEKEGVIAVVGPILSQTVIAAAEVADELQVPLLTPSATAPGLPERSPYVFRNALTNELQSRTLVSFATERLRLRSYAILAPSNALGQAMATAFETAVAAAQGQLVARIDYGVDETDFRHQIRQLKQEAPQAVFIPDVAERVALIAPQVRFHDLNDAILLGSNGWNSDRLVELAGDYVEGAFFVDAFFAGARDVHVTNFVRRYREEYGEAPDRLVAEAFDAAKLIASRIAEGNRSREALRKALLATRNFPGVAGNISFSPTGDVVKDLHLLTVERGRIVEVD